MSKPNIKTKVGFWIITIGPILSLISDYFVYGQVVQYGKFAKVTPYEGAALLLIYFSYITWFICLSLLYVYRYMENSALHSMICKTNKREVRFIMLLVGGVFMSVASLIAGSLIN